MAIQSTTNRISSSARSSAKTLVAKASKLPQLLFITAVAWFLFIGTAHGDVFVSDYGSQKIQRFDDNGNLLNGNFIPGIGQGEGVACVKAVGSSDIYVANNSSVIGVYDLTTGVKDPSKTIQLSPNVTRIAGISFNKDGSLLYAADWGLGRLLAIDPTTRTVKYSVTFSPPGPSHDVVVGPDGNVYATQFNNHTGVVMFSPDFTTRSQFVLPGDHGLQYPGGLVFDHAGNLWVTNFDPANSFVSEYSSLGAYMRTVQDPNGRPLGIDVGPDGNIYVANFNLNNVVKIDVAGGSYGVTTFIANAGTEPKYVKFTSSCCDAAQPGYVEICKVSCADHPVTGTFTFTATNGPFNSGPLTIPVGACTPAFQTPSGTVTINEGVQLGVELTNVTAYGYDQHGFKENRLLDSNLPHRTADVKVVEGDQSTETVATFTNCQSGPGELKICKVAGSGVKLGTNFTFMASTFGPPQLFTVPAGPAPGGYCVVAGMYQVGTPVLVQEVVPPGVAVTDIEVTPPDRGGTKTSNSVIAIIDSGTTEVTFTDALPPPQACSGQSLITIDPKHNRGYVPIYTKSANGDAQVEVVDLTVGAVSPLLATTPLPGANRVLATTYNPNNDTMLAEAVAPSGVLSVYEISTSTYMVLHQVPLTITFSGQVGGAIIEDYPHNRAFVGGLNQIGILDTSQSPPVWNPNSVVTVNGTDSMALNVATGILFVSADGNNQIIDTTKPLPLVVLPFESLHFGFADDGVAFDIATNILLMAEEAVGGRDDNWAFNFADLHYSISDGYYTANHHVIPGEGELSPWGDGPGGQAAINCSTHQGVIADEAGQNLKLIHLPTQPVPQGIPLDNMGDPCTSPGQGTPASVYTISGTVIPKGIVNNQPYSLLIAGDPNSLTIDPAYNFAYLMAYTFVGFQRPLFLVRMDLSNPVLGASPVPPSYGCAGTPWIPASAAIPMP